MVAPWLRDTTGVRTFANVSGLTQLDEIHSSEFVYGSWFVVVEDYLPTPNKDISIVTVSYSNGELQHNKFSQIKFGQVRGLSFDAQLDNGGKIKLYCQTVTSVKIQCYRFWSNLSYFDPKIPQDKKPDYWKEFSWRGALAVKWEKEDDDLHLDYGAGRSENSMVFRVPYAVSLKGFYVTLSGASNKDILVSITVNGLVKKQTVLLSGSLNSGMVDIGLAVNPSDAILPTYTNNSNGKNLTIYLLWG